MKITVNFCDFVDAFRRCDRYGDFGYDALQILFDYLEEYEESVGEEIELDVVAICCEYAVDKWEDIAESYSIDLSEYEDEEDKILAVREYLEENTSLVGELTEGEFVYQVF
jgi:hypothetical protein